jgi:ferredoxin
VKVYVDPEHCQGHTLCAMIAPHLFQLDDVDGHSSAPGVPRASSRRSPPRPMNKTNADQKAACGLRRRSRSYDAALALLPCTAA